MQLRIYSGCKDFAGQNSCFADKGPYVTKKARHNLSRPAAAPEKKFIFVKTEYRL
jgi:hypothetical protein